MSVQLALNKLLDVYVAPHSSFFQETGELKTRVVAYSRSLDSTFPPVHLLVSKNGGSEKESALAVFRQRVPVYYGRPMIGSYNPAKYNALLQELPPLSAPVSTPVSATERHCVVMDVPCFNSRFPADTKVRTAHIYGINFEKPNTSDYKAMAQFSSDAAQRFMIVETMTHMWRGLLVGALAGLPPDTKVRIRMPAVGMGAFLNALRSTEHRQMMWAMYCTALENVLNSMAPSDSRRIHLDMTLFGDFKDKYSPALLTSVSPNVHALYGVNLFDSSMLTKTNALRHVVDDEGAVFVLVNAWDSHSLVGNGGYADPTIDGQFVADAGGRNSSAPGGGLLNASYLSNATLLFSPTAVVFHDVNKPYRPAGSGGAGAGSGAAAVARGITEVIDVETDDEDEEAPPAPTPRRETMYTPEQFVQMNGLPIELRSKPPKSIAGYYNMLELPLVAKTYDDSHLYLVPRVDAGAGAGAGAAAAVVRAQPPAAPAVPPPARVEAVAANVAAGVDDVDDLETDDELDEAETDDEQEDSGEAVANELMEEIESETQNTERLFSEYATKSSKSDRDEILQIIKMIVTKNENTMEEGLELPEFSALLQKPKGRAIARQLADQRQRYEAHAREHSSDLDEEAPAHSADDVSESVLAGALDLPSEAEVRKVPLAAIATSSPEYARALQRTFEGMRKIEQEEEIAASHGGQYRKSKHVLNLSGPTGELAPLGLKTAYNYLCDFEQAKSSAEDSTGETSQRKSGTVHVGGYSHNPYAFFATDLYVTGVTPDRKPLEYSSAGDSGASESAHRIQGPRPDQYRNRPSGTVLDLINASASDSNDLTARYLKPVYYLIKMYGTDVLQQILGDWYEKASSKYDHSKHYPSYDYSTSPARLVTGVPYRESELPTLVLPNISPAGEQSKGTYKFTALLGTPYVMQSKLDARTGKPTKQHWILYATRTPASAYSYAMNVRLANDVISKLRELGATNPDATLLMNVIENTRTCMQRTMGNEETAKLMKDIINKSVAQCDRSTSVLNALRPLVQTWHEESESLGEFVGALALVTGGNVPYSVWKNLREGLEIPDGVRLCVHMPTIDSEADAGTGAGAGAGAIASTSADDAASGADTAAHSAYETKCIGELEKCASCLNMRGRDVGELLSALSAVRKK